LESAALKKESLSNYDSLSAKKRRRCHLETVSLKAYCEHEAIGLDPDVSDSTATASNS